MRRTPFALALVALALPAASVADEAAAPAGVSMVAVTGKGPIADPRGIMNPGVLVDATERPVGRTGVLVG